MNNSNCTLNNRSEDIMLAEADLTAAFLRYCAINPGATITISVEHDNGCKVSAKLYDHAALVQGIVDALDYFISEL